MKQFEDVLLSAFFTDEDIERLDEIFSKATNQYLIDLKADPFAHDWTNDDMAEEVKKLLSDKEIATEDSDVEILVSQLKYKLI